MYLCFSTARQLYLSLFIYHSRSVNIVVYHYFISISCITAHAHCSLIVAGAQRRLGHVLTQTCMFVVELYRFQSLDDCALS